jgi:hypothetical protein
MLGLTKLDPASRSYEVVQSFYNSLDLELRKKLQEKVDIECVEDLVNSVGDLPEGIETVRLKAELTHKEFMTLNAVFIIYGVESLKNDILKIPPPPPKREQSTFAQKFSDLINFRKDK